MSRTRSRRPGYDVSRAEAHLRAAHPRMSELLDLVGPCALTVHNAQPFEALAQSIVYQQLNGTAAATIFGRVLDIYAPKPFPSPHDLLATDDARLRAAGLSRAKMLAMKSLAQHALEGVVPTRAEALKLSNEELIERLTQVRGIGRWTVEMFLIFGLARPDVWPVLDFGVRKGLAMTYRKRHLPTPREAEPFARRFRPWSSVAAWYFWRACELEPEKLGLRSLPRPKPPAKKRRAKPAPRKAARTRSR